MFNHEILEKIISNFGVEKAIDFCRMMSFRYTLLHEANSSCEKEYDYEANWWKNEEIKLVNYEATRELSQCEELDNHLVY
jgi:hypothetical protein